MIVLIPFNFSIGRGSSAGEGHDWSERYCKNLSRGPAVLGYARKVCKAESHSIPITQFKPAETRITDILGTLHNFVLPDCCGQCPTPFAMVFVGVCNGLKCRGLLPGSLFASSWTTAWQHSFIFYFGFLMVPALCIPRT